MIVTIREAYECSKNYYPIINIGKSAFYSLQPVEVLPVMYTFHAVCVCAQHSNIINKDCRKDFWNKFDGNKNLSKAISWKEWAKLGRSTENLN